MIFQSFFETLTIKNQMLSYSTITGQAFMIFYSSWKVINFKVKDLTHKGGYMFSTTSCFNTSFTNIYALNIIYGGIFELKSTNVIINNLNIQNNISLINSYSMIYVSGISDYFVLNSSNISYCQKSGNGAVNIIFFIFINKYD